MLNTNESYGIIQNQYHLERKDTKTGYKETIVYTGNLKDKPKGWKVINKEV